MIIEELTLNGYYRLLLCNIQRFNYRPASATQLIIGTNGSGKSSLMYELANMIPSSSDYAKGGGKTIRLSHRGSNYVMSSNFQHGNKHSFIRDGEELNDGRTGAAQKELVKKHLGLDKDLVDVLLGTYEGRFTTMSPMKRRDWIMRLSGNDLDYAMSVFDTAKVKLRDAQGAVKHLSKRLSEATENLPSDDSIQRMVNDCAEMQELLTFLMDNRENGLPSGSEVMQRIESLNKAIITQSKAILSDTLTPVPGYRFTTLDEVKEARHQLEISRATANTLLSEYCEDYSRLTSVVETMVANNMDNVEQLKTELAEQRKNYDDMMVSYAYPELLVLERASELQSATTAIEGTLYEILSEIPEGGQKRYNQQSKDAHLEKRTEYMARLDRLTRDHTKIEHRLSHIEKAETSNCPKCGFIWVPGVETNEKEALLTAMERNANEQRTLRHQLEETNDWLEHYECFRTYIRRLNQLVSTNADLKPLWNAIANEWADGVTPRRAIAAISKWHHALNHSIAMAEVKHRISKLQDALLVLESEQDGRTCHFTQQMKELEDGIRDRTEEVATLYTTYRAVEKLEKQVDRITRDATQFRLTFQTLCQEMELYARTLRRDGVNRLIGDYQTQLASLTAALNRARAAETVLEEIKRLRKEALADAEALTVIVKELSPTDGLIADLLRGFIECFVEQMNAVIQQVWTYPMEILPCGMEESGLDYKFPVLINGSDRPVPDVSAGSVSQLEIFDFAFKLVVMLYLEMSDYPLFVDELGANMDERHRFNLIGFIKQYVETRRCSQLFMISHYASQHGSFAQAEVCVMDATNLINRPAVYNQHVTME